MGKSDLVFIVLTIEYPFISGCSHATVLSKVRGDGLMSKCSFLFVKLKGISWLLENRLVSQEELYSVEQVRFIYLGRVVMKTVGRYREKLKELQTNATGYTACLKKNDPISNNYI